MSDHKHHHDHHCSCGHEHHHDDHCSCEHEHHHDHHCSCGHEHHHDDHCSCGHEHQDSPHIHQHIAHPRTGKPERRIYILENLGCANCAAKMERRINELENVSDATITFATRQLRLLAEHTDHLLPQLQEICSSIEPEVNVIPKEPVVPRKAPVKKNVFAEHSITFLTLGFGILLFILSQILAYNGTGAGLSLVFNIVAYLLLGGKILVTAFKNLTKGHIFDENFLMSIATLGAFAIQEYPEAVGVMLFYRIGEFFEDIAVEKSRSQIMDAVDLRPEVVNLLIYDDVQVIPAEEAAAGDILLVRPGDRIPLDGIVIEGESRIDTSAITGEPVPITAKVGDNVISGCVNTSGLLKIRVEKPLSESMVTRILDSVENAAASKPQIDRFITRFARIYTPFVVILALGTAIIPSLFTGNWNHWIYTALTFLVISCPCALVLSVPLSFFSGIGTGSRHGILFKGGMALEQLADIKSVVMDKTGTITEGNFILQDIVTLGSYSKEELLLLTASCEQTSTHPIAHSIVSAAKEQHLVLQSVEHLEELPGHGIKGIIGNTTILCGNCKLMEHFGVNISSCKKTIFGSEVFIAVNGILEGSLLISDTIKTDSEAAIKSLKSLGVATAMLTGDAQENADAVATAVGIDEVHAKLLPEEKLSELVKIRAAHQSVMFVGDGINDAPVLAGADVGAAMGNGADAAIEAADVVFMNSNLSSIPLAIKIARASRNIAWQNVIFALTIKAAVMILGLTGHASMWMAVFADSGVAMLCVLNSIRILYQKTE